MEPLPLTYNISTNRNYLLLTIAGSLFCVGLFLWIPVSLAVFLGAIFVGLFVYSRTFRWLVFPTVLCFHYNLFGVWGIRFQFAGLTILPADWVAFLLLGAVLLNKLLSAKPFFESIALERPTAVLLTVLIGTSYFGTTGIKGSVVGIGHILLYFLFLYSAFTDWKDVPVKTLWRSYELWALPAAISILWYFFSSGGGRSLGVGSFWFSVIILPVIFVRLVEWSVKAERGLLFFLGIWVLAILASQTRGAWIGLGIGVLTWAVIGFLLREKCLKQVSTQLGFSFLKLTVFLVVILLVVSPFLGSTQKRAVELISGSGTIFLRFVLWDLAWKVFLMDPLTGVGLWQFHNVVQQLPGVKNLAVFQIVKGLTPHNMFLEVLAETGVFGALALLFFFASVLKRAWKIALQARTIEEISFGWGLFLTLFYFATGIFYAETWITYPFMFFLALLLILENQLKSGHFKTSSS